MKPTAWSLQRIRKHMNDIQKVNDIVHENVKQGEITDQEKLFWEALFVNAKVASGSEKEIWLIISNCWNNFEIYITWIFAQNNMPHSLVYMETEISRQKLEYFLKHK